jgi:undecaprenyl diphosphate synthase
VKRNGSDMNKSLNDGLLPKHVAVIMDGNRRWAKERGKSVVEGHTKVVHERIEELIERAAEWGIPYITFWAFSTENWGRGQDEVTGIMSLFRWALKRKAKKLIKQGARVRMIGDLSKFPEDIQGDFAQLVQNSAHNTRITATFALNYGGQDEILRGIREVFHQIHDSRFTIQELTTTTFSNFLDTAGMPDPDLIIRTSGEQRLSGFMPWQSVYAEFYFTKILMPDFDGEQFDEAIEEFGRRKRRFGKS